jgi:hypothetical protein
LDVWWEANVANWLQLVAGTGRNTSCLVSSNYWATTSRALIDAAIYDFNDDFNLGHYVYEPILTNAPAAAYPFVVDVGLSTASATNVAAVGAEPVTFTVTFNRDMSLSVAPQVSFGPAVPYTDYAVQGGWRDARTWVGGYHITPVTGDGYQLMRVAGAVAADDPWLVTGDDAGRFRFQVITAGTEAMNLQAVGGEGKVDLSWLQDDFDLLAGYNLYRSTNPSNSFDRLNSTIIPMQQKFYRDVGVQPGQPYYYKFTVVKSDMSESAFSNVAQGTPLDTIPPVIVHTPVTTAEPGLPLTILADVTDNVGVQGVTLYFRGRGGMVYQSRGMTLVSGSRYAATIEGSWVSSPGLDYYLEASDGVNTVRSGQPELPNTVVVVDQPVVTGVSPESGPASGGVLLTIAGGNFKVGATVMVGGVTASNVVWVSSSQLTCVTPAHFPAVVDVQVRNPDGQNGTLLRGFVFVSDAVSLSLPDTAGAQGDLVGVPVSVGNVQGLVAVDLTVTFNAGVLRGVAARPGTLTSGWSLAVNTNTAGQVKVSLASPGGTVSGTGSLAWLDLEVIGLPGSSSPLHLANVALNGGAIQVQSADGSFAVALAYKVSGAVRFWNGGVGVAGVEQTLSGGHVFRGISGTNGVYMVGGAPAGAYTLTPRKSDMVNGITAYDASLVLQHAVGLVNLEGSAASAADVDKSGSITSLDAFYVLQAAVGLITLPFPGAGVVWDFSPTNRTYANLSADLTGQDFQAILLGDVSGNWSPGGGSLAMVRGASAGATSGRTSVVASVDTNRRRPAVCSSLAPVILGLRTEAVGATGDNRVWLVVKAPAALMHSLDVVLAYDPATTLMKQIRLGPFGGTLAMASNTNEPGTVRVALAGALPLKGVGGLLIFELRDLGGSDLRILGASVNEGAVPVEINPGGAVFDQDSDGDGQTDWEEIQAGTDPNNKDSVFRIETVVPRADGSRVVRWSAVAGRQYRLQSKDFLFDADWREVGEVVVATGETASQIDGPAPEAGGCFYRVLLVK